MKVMITGVSGFVGGYLAKHCLEAGCSVLGLGIKTPGEDWVGAGSVFQHCDMRDTKAVYRAIATFRPDRIFHLAAQSYPTVSMLQPLETMETNVCGTVNLYEGIREAGIQPKVVIACSSAEYGPVTSDEVPVKETHALCPVHPYGVSKVAQDLLAAQYFANYGIASVRIRLFNTTGAGKLGDVCADFTKRAVEIELGIRPPKMRVGDVTRLRAIADVRDVVRAFWLASEHGEAGEVYNVGNDKVYSIQDIIDYIRPRIPVSFSVEQDPALMRTCDEPIIAGDISKFQACTGWKPEIALEETVGKMVEWWRAHFAKQAAFPQLANSSSI